ncbi:MAG: NTP transferase domain-containing protein [Pyrinomonadaceae bacterium]
MALYGDGPVNVLRAPARINILGEHVDYVSYLPTASLTFGSREHDMLMLYRAAETDRVRGASTIEDYPPFVFTLSGGPAAASDGEVEAGWLSYLYGHPAPASHWGNYVKGAVYFARVRCGAQVQRGFDFVVDSGIPPGGGASSSSALVILASAAAREVNRIEYMPEELARAASKAEWYVGTRGGAMDHTTICLARLCHAVLIEYLEDRARRVPLAGREFRWVTFFSQPADKGREVMFEYNERAGVSRVLIPAVIEGWKTRRQELHAAWLEAVGVLQMGSVAALDEVEKLMRELPPTLTVAEIERDYPEAFSELSRAFPALIRDCGERPMQVRARALHHIGEVRRVGAATRVLDATARPSSGIKAEEQIDSAMRALGELLRESHSSLRDLYGVSTPEVERLLKIIESDANVYGARLMGGGFGGNVLALIKAEHVSALVERVQITYYGPQNRHGVDDGAVMISTPGDGLTSLSVEAVWREAFEQFNSSGPNADEHRKGLTRLLDNMPLDTTVDEVWPVIVAAGKGTRARATGLDVPKPLASVLGVPAVVHVLRNVRAALDSTRAPVVIISPETEAAVRVALAGEDVEYVLQREALGTGDAVLCARERMQDFAGRALIVWSTQPVVRPETIRRTLKLAALFNDYDMVLPTALMAQPYAPLLRDERGQVKSARETHLEQAERPPAGESNVGLFVLKSRTMFVALAELRLRYWDESQRRYTRVGGELGFPNELINYLAERQTGVFASPIADRREEQGIKNLDDVARCEKYISDLSRGDS